MRNPDHVLNGLAKHSADPDYKYRRLYRILYNPDMFMQAYYHLYGDKQGRNDKAARNNAGDKITQRTNTLIERLKDESYHPVPVNQLGNARNNARVRSMRMDDKLVQEVLHMVLEAMYEGQFTDYSHGFRPGRNCHTALDQMKKNFVGTKWFIKGDLRSFFTTIDHHVLIGILSERIEDQKFLRLIWKFLDAGYMEQWIYNKTYSGTPQGGILNPILINICLDKLDQYMKEYIGSFSIGKCRKKNPEYRRLTNRKTALKREFECTEDEIRRTEIMQEIRDVDVYRRTIPAGIPDDSSYRRLKYVRYGGDFLLGVIGSKEDCRKIKEDIREFLRHCLKLQMAEDRLQLVHASKPVQFLGYQITVPISSLTKRSADGRNMRTYTGHVTLKISMDTIRDRLLALGAIKVTYPEGVEVWIPEQIGYLTQNDDLEILEFYNSVIWGFYDYYGLATNSANIGSFAYHLEYSMYKTFAGKYRTTKGKIIDQYRIGKDFGVEYTDKNGVQRVRLFYNYGFKRRETPLGWDCDRMPNTNRFRSKTGREQRLNARVCEWCGAENCEIHVHHIHKLKDLQGKNCWQRFASTRGRKVLMLCASCHSMLHRGTLD